MVDSRKYQTVEVAESERIPNKFTCKVLLGILLALFFACIINQFGVFGVDKLLMWICFIVSAIMGGVAFILVEDKDKINAPYTKYILMSITLLLVLLVNVFLNISVVLLLLLPIFLATSYRTTKISTLAIVGTAIISIISPLIAWALQAWSYNILVVYLENACNVKIIESGEANIDTIKVIFNLLLYVTLPQLIVIFIFGPVTMGITKNSISGLKNRLKVMKFTDSLTQQLDRVSLMQDRILFSMADLIESRDHNTGNHVKRTCEVVRLIVNEMQNDPDQHLSDSFCTAIVNAAPLHDIGKICVDDAILRKPGRLDEFERSLVNNHSVKGAEIIKNVLTGIENEEFLEIAINIALYHHESYDGTGYPKKLKGEEIPLEARIMTIADVYDALVTKRSYKDALSSDVAFKQMQDLMGKQFDPNLNKYFVAVRKDIEEFYLHNK